MQKYKADPCIESQGSEQTPCFLNSLWILGAARIHMDPYGSQSQTWSMVYVEWKRQKE